MISEEEFKTAAETLNIEVAIIKAVAEVESHNNGFLINGKPVILFEPYVFWRQLEKNKIDPKSYVDNNSDILCDSYKKVIYGRLSEQYNKLERAITINKEAALSSASWGRFQLMGFNWKVCGFESLEKFIEAMNKSEYEHLLAFVKFVQSLKLENELKNKEWENFAKHYNGKDYQTYEYDKKLKKAYEKYLILK